MKHLKRLWHKLDFKLTLLVLVLSILPLIILGIFALGRSHQALEQQQFNHLNAVAMLKGDEIDRWVNNNVQQLNALAQRPLVREYADTLAQAETAVSPSQLAYDNLLANHLLPMLVVEGGFRELFLLNKDGQIIASTDENNEGKDGSSEQYFVDGKRAAAVQNVYLLPALGKPVITIGTPVHNGDGVVVAVLAGHLNLAELSMIAEQTNELTDTEDTYLVNKFKFFVTDPRFGQNYLLQKTINTSGVNRCLQQKNGHGIYTDYRGTAVLGAFRWLPQYELCILTEIDHAEAVGAINAMRRSIFIVGTVVAVGIVTSGLFFTRSITAPLHQLKKGLEHIGKGELDHQIPVNRQDEIGHVTAVFNQMARNLRDSIGETIHGQQLLSALSQAAQIAQQAQTPQEVYNSIGAEMARLNFEISILLLTEDQKHLQVGYMSYDSSVIRAAEKLSGLSAATYHFSLPPDGYFDQTLKDRKTIFISPMSDFIAEALPKSARFLADRLANLLNMKQGIVAPLIVDEEPLGLLIVIGENLAKPEITAVTAFANQISIALQNTRFIAKLRQNEARFRAIFEHAGIGIARVNMEGKPLESNLTLQEMLGYSQDELQQMVFTEFTHPEDAANDMALYQSLIAGERDVYEIDKRYMRKDGNLVWARLTVSLVRDADGESEFAIGMVQDITEQQQIQEAHNKQRVFLESIYDGADLAIFVVEVSADGEFRFGGLNPAHERLTGLKSDHVRGKSPHDLVPTIPPAAADAIHANYARCLAAGEAISYEEMILIDGRETWWLTRLSPLRNAQGRIFRIVGTALSISERKQAEQRLRDSQKALRDLNKTLEQRVVARTKALQESENRFRRAITDAPFPIMMHAEDGEVMHLSDVWVELTGYTPAEIPTIDAWTQKAYGQKMEFTKEIINRLYGSDQKVKEGEFTITTQSEKQLVWDFSSSPLGKLPDGRRFVISMAMDVTARKQVMKELERSNEELQQFAYVASHDLQEPLRMVTSYLQLIQRRYGNKLDNDADEFIGYAVDGANRMKQLIQDLLALSRVGTWGKPFETVDSTEIMQLVLDNLKTSIEETDACITFDALPQITADHSQIVQLFQNLISNAIKFRREAQPQIHIGVKRQKSTWQFSVQDNGIGFDPKFSERIFVIFQRLHTANYGGTGIGLAVCKKIVERHGGQIWTDSEPDVGTTIHFTIPVREQNDKENDQFVID